MEHWSLRLRIFLFFAFIAAGGLVVLAGGFALALSRLGPEAMSTLVLAFGGAGFAVTGLALWVWLQFDENLAKPITAMGQDVRAAVHGGVKATSTQRGRYLGYLGPAVAEVTRALAEARAETERRVVIATEEAHRQRAQLEAVLRDLQEGVVICNLEHEILLYNQRAGDILHQAGEVGLGRPFFALVAGEPFRFAVERLRRRFVEDRWTDHPDGLTALAVAPTRRGRLTLKAQVALTVDEDRRAPVGYVVAFEDATEEIDAAQRRDSSLHDTAEALRRRMASLAALTEVTLKAPELSAAERADLQATLARERDAATTTLDRLDEIGRDALVNPWPTSPIYASTLIAFLGDRVASVCALNTGQIPPDLWVRCDSASMLALLDHVVRHLAAGDITRQVLVEMRASSGRVLLDLVWTGPPVPEPLLGEWMRQSLGEGLAGLTARDVLDRHKTDLWCVRRGEAAALRLPLPRARAAGRHPRKTAPTLSARPEFYDFDLFARPTRSALGDAGLRELTYVVFDTETTGLEPQRDDEIVQIGGVRIVNGRVLRGEVFDRLVNPGRRIPPASTRIHGIADADVAEADPLPVAVPHFHAFIGESVLVAHNAPFDMSFLTKHQRAFAVTFTQPVLDTVLLAAHVFGPGESLTLDALAERLEIRLPERERHTALGDALATAHVFVRLMALLEADGTRTLNDALRVSEQQVALRRRQGVYQQR